MGTTEGQEGWEGWAPLSQQTHLTRSHSRQLQGSHKHAVMVSDTASHRLAVLVKPHRLLRAGSGALQRRPAAP
jgi:hypothetical protein